MGTDWRQAALCIGHDPELWFPKSGRESSATRAIRICAGCPVRQQCLSFAIDNEIDYGIFGGIAAIARRGDRNKPRQYSTVNKTELQPCGTPAAAMRHRRHNDPPCDVCRTGRGRYPDGAQAPASGAQALDGDDQLQAATSCA